MFLRVTCLAWLISIASSASAQVAVTGSVSGELRTFPQQPGIVEQNVTAIQPTLIGDAKIDAGGLPGSFRATFNPYIRYDTVDNGRSIFDLHELNVDGGAEHWHVKVGYDVQFWGVMEFVNPVNVLNQTDITEDFLGKRKLGQLLANYTLTDRVGTIEVFALSGFQPMRFPQSAGRLRAPVSIRQDDVTYSSGNGRSQLEGAVRYFRNVGKVYFGLSHFYGYGREPELRIELDDHGRPFLDPAYNLEHQTGAELQITFGNLILKSEDVFRFEPHIGRQSKAISVGTEYNVGALMETRRTMTLFSEYYYDSRDQSLIIPFRNDVFAGLRVSMNDRRSSEVRVWGNYDLTTRSATALMLDANTRISDRLKIAAAYRGIVTGAQAFSSISHDSHVVLKLEAFF
jgi:hypothetical protein